MDRRRFKEPNIISTEYQPVEYLESTGTQWINTGVVWETNDFEIEIKYVMVAGRWSNSVFGAQDAPGTRSIPATYSTPTDLFFYIGGTSEITSVINFIDEIKLKNVGNEMSCYSSFYNKTSKINHNGDVIGSNPIYLFSLNVGGASLYKSRTKIYNFIAKQNGAYKISLIPCYRKSDNKPGMYDLVNNQFYTNDGTGEFIIGPEVKPDCDLPGELGPDNPLKAKFIGYKKIGELPNEYQEVEYLESTGTQYLGTDILSNKNYSYLKTNVKYICDDLTAIKTGRLFGITGITTSSYYLGRSYNFTYNVGADTLDTTNYLKIGLNEYESIFDKGNISFTYNNYKQTAKSTFNNINTGLFGILCRYRVDYATYAEPIGKIKLCAFKMYSETNCILYLIPCYHKSDNKPGMYDIVHSKFYTNQGTGEFLVGPDVQSQIIVDRLWDYERGFYNPTTGEFIEL